jgi:hypothetical protein
MEPLPNEEWRPIPGFDGYEVSNLGRVVSYRRRRPVLLNPRTRESGHLAVGLRVNPSDFNPKTRLVHQLVMEAFVGPCPEGLEVCHNNGNPADNVLSNLRYDTHSANAQDSVRHGTHHYASRTHCKRGHEYTDANTARRSNGARRCRACLFLYRTNQILRADGVEVAA